MLQKLRGKLKSRRGELYLDVLLSVFALCLCISLALAVLPVFITKLELDIVAKEAARVVAITGNAGEFEDAVRNIGQRNGWELDDFAYYSCDPPNGRIQLEREFTVELGKEVQVSMGGFARGFTITLTSTASGRSERYDKDQVYP